MTPSPISTAPRVAIQRSMKLSITADAKPIWVLNRLPMPAAKVASDSEPRVTTGRISPSERPPPDAVRSMASSVSPSARNARSRNESRPWIATARSSVPKSLAVWAMAMARGTLISRRLPSSESATGLRVASMVPEKLTAAPSRVPDSRSTPSRAFWSRAPNAKSDIV